MDGVHSFQNITDDIKHKYEDGKVVINEYAGVFKKRTLDYINVVDDKVNEYKNYINEQIQ